MDKRIYSQMMFIKSKAPYYHDDVLEIILVLKGQLKVYKMERSFVLNEGEFTLINRHIVHYLESEQGANVLVSHVKLDQFKHIFKRIEYVEFLNNNEIYEIDRPLKKQLNIIAVDSLIKLYQMQGQREKAAEIEFEEDQLMHMFFLNYQLITHIKEVEEYPTTELLDRYYQVVEYILNNIHQKIMTEDIINLVYMNPTYFSQFMKRIGGVGFKEFVFYRKLIMICKYLLDPCLTMNETALRVGITDMKSFYSNFKKSFHMSPSKWRHMVEGIHDDYRENQDMHILHEFIEAYHIYRHRDNTMTRTLKFILKCSETDFDLDEVNIEIDPFDDMGDTYDPDYQVYKHYGALTRIKNELGATLLMHFPMKYLCIDKQAELFIAALSEHVLLFGVQTMRKDRILLRASNEVELKKAKEIESIIYKKIGHLNVTISYRP